MTTSNKPDELAFHFSSVKRLPSEALVAAPLGQGIVHKNKPSDEWEKINEGLPEDTHINRLQVCDDRLYACSDKGLFACTDRKWMSTALCVSCYQYKEFGPVGLAGTSCGLWFKENRDEQWHLMMRSDVIVYDFLYLPQYVILGTDQGLSILDRLTTTWMNCRYGSAVTSLAVFKGGIVGATEHGELLVGNKRGAFERYRMGSTYVFSIVTKNDEVFACTDRGLYRLSRIGGTIALMAVKLGCQVTDVDTDGEHLYLATLFEGVKRVNR